MVCCRHFSVGIRPRGQGNRMETAVTVLYKIIYTVPEIIYSLISLLFSTSTPSAIQPFTYILSSSVVPLHSNPFASCVFLPARSTANSILLLLCSPFIVSYLKPQHTDNSFMCCGHFHKSRNKLQLCSFNIKSGQFHHLCVGKSGLCSNFPAHILCEKRKKNI